MLTQGVIIYGDEIGLCNITSVALSFKVWFIIITNFLFITNNYLCTNLLFTSNINSHLLFSLRFKYLLVPTTAWKQMNIMVFHITFLQFKHPFGHPLLANIWQWWFNRTAGSNRFNIETDFQKNTWGSSGHPVDISCPLSFLPLKVRIQFLDSEILLFLPCDGIQKGETGQTKYVEGCHQLMD